MRSLKSTLNNFRTLLHIGIRIHFLPCGVDYSLTKNYDFERFGLPFRRGDRWYYMHNSGLQSQSVYYSIEADKIDTKEQGTVFFDPNGLSEDGTVAVCPILIGL